MASTIECEHEPALGASCQTRRDDQAATQIAVSESGHHIAAELEARGIASISGQKVYNIPARPAGQGLALKGRSDGIAYPRYEKEHLNEQWHIDLRHLTLTDGTRFIFASSSMTPRAKHGRQSQAPAEQLNGWHRSLDRPLL